MSDREDVMYKIDKKYYKNFYELFEELGSYTFLQSSLEGIVNGKLYADDPLHPTCGIMLTADLNYIVGDLNRCEEELFKLTQADDFYDHTGFIFSSKNIPMIKKIFGKHAYEYVKRYNHQLMKSDFMYQDLTLNDEELVRLTPNNIEEYKQYTNYEELYEECMFYWNEYPKDSKINFAIALVRENIFLSYAYVCGESSSENSCEIGIETFNDYKRRGYAVLLSLEIINELIHFGYDLFNWHCHADNIGSSKTALKLGFKNVDETYLAWFKKNIED